MAFIAYITAAALAVHTFTIAKYKVSPTIQIKKNFKQKNKKL